MTRVPGEPIPILEIGVAQIGLSSQPLCSINKEGMSFIQAARLLDVDLRRLDQLGLLSENDVIELVGKGNMDRWVELAQTMNAVIQIRWITANRGIWGLPRCRIHPDGTVQNADPAGDFTKKAVPVTPGDIAFNPMLI